MEQQVKVLHVLNGLGFGGAETWLLEIMKKNRGRVQFDFLLTGGEVRELDNAFIQQGCKLHYVKFSGRGILSFIRSINKIIKEGNYVAVHDHEDFVAGWHWLFLLFRLPGIRISHAHNSMIFINNYANSTGRKLFYKTGKFLNGLLASRITGTSQKLMAELGYDHPFFMRKRIEPLYCGSEPDVFSFNPEKRTALRNLLGFGPSDRVVIFIGRIGLNRDNEINHKNPEFAFSLSQKMVTSNSSYKFLFVGEKDRLGNAMEEEVAQKGLSNSIFFLGKRKDVGELMMAADLLLFTSTLEPFGLVLVEAQFSALQVVASTIITKETIIFPSLFTLLDVSKGDLVEWSKAINDRFEESFDRLAFSTEHQQQIKDSAFSTANSYNRLLKYYEIPLAS